jgi:multidrug efflux system outer membrane protein
MMRHQRVLAVARGLPVAATLGLAACAGLPSHDADRAPLVLPSQWGEAAPAAREIAPNWWKAFGDDRLDALVDEALRGNSDLARAIARVDESRAALKIARADRFPAVYGSASANRSRISEVGRQPLFGADPVGGTYNASLTVQYEADLWGKYAQAAAAARAELLSTEAARDTVRLTIAAQAAQSYFALRSLDASVEATRQLIDKQRESLKLQRARAENGALSQFDLARLEAELAASEARLPALQKQRTQAETALAVLLGRSPRDVYTPDLARAGVADLRGLSTVVVTPAGLPSELLLRRPDIRTAEQDLAAADARVAVARANYFPSIELTGQFGSESARLSDLFSGPAAIWSFAASLTQPIFQAGRLFAATDQAVARRAQTEATYRTTVATAFKEVKDALTGVEKSGAIYDAQSRRYASLQRARELADVRYRNGYASLLDLIDADRQLLEAALGQAEAERDQRDATVDLFRALGGGWNPAASSPPQPALQSQAPRQQPAT